MTSFAPFTTDRLTESAYLLDDNPVLVVEWHTRRILACNDAVTRVFGYEPAELLGQDTRLLHVSDASFESFGLTSEAFLGSGYTTYQCNYRMRRKDGTVFPTENLVQLIHDVDEGQVAVASFVRDLSGSSIAGTHPEQLGMDSAHPLAMEIPGAIFRRIRDIHGRDRYTHLAGGLLNELEIDPAAARENPDVILSMIEPEDGHLLENTIHSSAKSLSAFDLILRLQPPSGGLRWLRVISRPQQMEDGSVVWDGIAIDVSAEKKAHEQAAWLATHDRLTGVINRTEFAVQLERTLEHAQRDARHIALAQLSVHGMFRINETHGLEGGDALLGQIAARLVESLGEDDIVARSHGDVFLVALDVGEREGELATAVQRLRAIFATPFDIDNQNRLRAEASIGIARYPDDSDTAEGLLRAAALAGERAHRHPEVGYEFYDPTRGEQIRQRFRLEVNLRKAIRNEELEPHYQPQVSLADGELVGMEALARWPQADGPVILPGDFIPLAEDSGMSGEIGRLILGRVARDLSNWSRKGLRSVAVAVNCSAQQFRDINLVEEYSKNMREHGLAPGMINLEITESALIENLENAERIMARLNAQGVTFSIDDFGTGFSSLSYLSKLPFKVLKIDRSFVARIVDDEHQRNVVQGLIRMASTIGLYVVAEGIETAEQEAEMKRMGCDAAQGFHYSPALPAKEVERWLAP